jgi:NitT/TauT family transport system ATP-binding protein
MEIVPKIDLRIDRLSFVVRDQSFGGQGEFVAIRDVRLRISAGEFFTIVGPSGCGKSTLLEILAGLTEPTSGVLKIDGVEVRGPSLSRGIVFQQYALLPWRSALSNIEFSLEAQGSLSRRERRERRERARAAISLIGLEGFEDRYPHELSGGMKQRVAIARSLVYEPDILLMDEPFGALDAQTRELLQEELLSLWRRTGSTIIFITHSIEEAVYLGQRVAVMTAQPGRIRALIDIGLPATAEGEDRRTLPEFTRYRHQIWSLIQSERARSAVLDRLSA